MSTYTKITDFAAKDALLTGNPSKIVKGTEIGAEFDSIAVADASNVKGPTVSVTDNAVVRWDTTTGRIVQGSSVTIDDTGNIAGTSFTGAHNGTVGATTPSTGAFTTLSASGAITASGPLVTTSANLAHQADAAKLSYEGSSVSQLSAYGVNTSTQGVLNIVSKSSNGSLTTVVGTFSTTGLAVTGALSATGNASVGIASAVSLGANVSTLDIAGSAGGGLRFRTSGAGNSGYLQAIASGIDFGTADALPIRFITNATPQATIDTSGNLGLGVTPSAWDSIIKPLEFFGSAYVGGQTSGVPSVYVGANAYYLGGAWKYKTTNPATNYISSNGAHNWYTAPSGTAGNAITFTQSLAVGLGTTLALEGATSAAGTGIAFPATQLASSNANTLDDYEEGTWTPADGSGAGLSFSSASGTYTKVGRLVTAAFSAVYPATANASAAKISGLPFSSGTGNLSSGFTLTYTTSASLFTGITATTTLNFYSTAGATVANSTLGGADIRGVITYYV